MRGVWNRFVLIAKSRSNIRERQIGARICLSNVARLKTSCNDGKREQKRAKIGDRHVENEASL